MIRDNCERFALVRERLATVREHFAAVRDDLATIRDNCQRLAEVRGRLTMPVRENEREAREREGKSERKSRERGKAEKTVTLGDARCVPGSRSRAWAAKPGLVV